MENTTQDVDEVSYNGKVCKHFDDVLLKTLMENILDQGYIGDEHYLENIDAVSQLFGNDKFHYSEKVSKKDGGGNFDDKPLKKSVKEMLKSVFKFTPIVKCTDVLSENELTRDARYILCRYYLHLKLKDLENVRLEDCTVTKLNRKFTDMERLNEIVSSIKTYEIQANSFINRDSEFSEIDNSVRDIFAQRDNTIMFPCGNEIEITANYRRAFRLLLSNRIFDDKSKVYLRKSYRYVDPLINSFFFIRVDYKYDDISDLKSNAETAESRISVKHLYDKTMLVRSDVRRINVKRAHEYTLDTENYKLSMHGDVDNEEDDDQDEGDDRNDASIQPIVFKSSIVISNYYKYENNIVVRFSLRVSNVDVEAIDDVDDCVNKKISTVDGSEHSKTMINTECEDSQTSVYVFDSVSMLLYGYFGWQLSRCNEIRDYEINTSSDVFEEYAKQINNNRDMDVINKYIKTFKIVYEKFQRIDSRVDNDDDDRNNGYLSTRENRVLNSSINFSNKDFLKMLNVLRDENEECVHNLLKRIKDSNCFSIEEMYNFNTFSNQCIKF